MTALIITRELFIVRIGNFWVYLLLEFFELFANQIFHQSFKLPRSIGKRVLRILGEFFSQTVGSSYLGFLWVNQFFRNFSKFSQIQFSNRPSNANRLRGCQCSGFCGFIDAFLSFSYQRRFYYVRGFIPRIGNFVGS